MADNGECGAPGRAEEATMRLIWMVPLVLLAACASKPPVQPDWVSGGAASYPPAEFLLGRGSGTDVAQAQERARADLAKGFEVAVSAAGEDVQTAVRSGEASSYTAKTEQRVSTQTDLVVRGVRIAELWRDPASGAQHALAVLSRLQAANALRGEISRLDQGIARDVARAQQAGDALAQAGAANRALGHALERDGVQRMLKVVDASGIGAPPQYASGRLRADLDALLARVRIGVEAADGDAEFANMVRAAVAAAGFGGATPSDYRLASTLEAEDLGRIDGWYWLRASLTLVLRDAAGGVRGQRTWAFKASGQEPETARSRLRQSVEATLGRELRATIVGFAK